MGKLHFHEHMDDYVVVVQVAKPGFSRLKVFDGGGHEANSLYEEELPYDHNVHGRVTEDHHDQWRKRAREVIQELKQKQEE